MTGNTVVLPPPSHSAAVSDIGKREANQDACLRDDTLGVYAVADGVGGSQAGDVASMLAIKTVRDHVAKWRAQPEKDRPHPSTFVESVVQAACTAVHTHAEQQRELAGMSTTLTMVLLHGETAVMGHVGDSRLYLLRDGALEQISTDHTLAAELYRGGVITREHVARHPHARVLTRNCGSQPSVMVDTLKLEVHPGDILLLCSDGLNPALQSVASVIEVLDSAELQPALEMLCRQALAEGSRDNITAVAWRRDGDTPPLTGPIVDALRQVPLLSALGLADLCRVAAVMTPSTHAPGDVVLDRGEPAAGLHVVLQGRLRWTYDPTHFALLERGTGIGTTTLVAPRRCPAQLHAEVETHTLTLSCEAFRTLAQRRPRLGNHLLTALAAELSDWIDPDTDRGVARPPHGLLVEF